VPVVDVLVPVVHRPWAAAPFMASVAGDPRVRVTAIVQEPDSESLEAWALAGPTAVVVLGTGSMAPYIPAAPAGADPLRTVCALVILAPDARYTDITSGALCIYTPNWAGRNVIHQAAKIDGDGWVMTGLSNRYSESGERVTASNFVGIVARTYVWQPILP